MYRRLAWLFQDQGFRAVALPLASGTVQGPFPAKAWSMDAAPGPP